MLHFLSDLTTNQRLALLAFVLGLAAIFATPTRGGRVSLDSREMTLLMQNGADRIDVRTLASWIIKGQADFRLIDLRDAAAYAAGPRIPNAENIPVSTLADAGLGRGERILLVADDEAMAAQAWFLLHAQGFKGVYVVRGGLRAWQDEIVFPRVDGLDQAQRSQAEAVSAHFGGALRTGEPAGSRAPVATAHSAASPPPSAPGAKKPAPAKKKEGC
jgi:rhodanese-related sulfurtransferase